MTRTYQVKYKSKSKMLTTPEKVEDTKDDFRSTACKIRRN